MIYSEAGYCRTRSRSGRSQAKEHVYDVNSSEGTGLQRSIRPSPLDWTFEIWRKEKVSADTPPRDDARARAPVICGMIGDRTEEIRRSDHLHDHNHDDDDDHSDGDCGGDDTVQLSAGRIRVRRDGDAKVRDESEMCRVARRCGGGDGFLVTTAHGSAAASEARTSTSSTSPRASEPRMNTTMIPNAPEWLRDTSDDKRSMLFLRLIRVPAAFLSDSTPSASRRSGS